MDRGMTADQVLGALWRRKTLVLAIAVGVFAVGAIVVMAMPSIYSASVVVRVQPQRPTEEMVQRTVSELIEQRLLTVRQELMSRPLLEKAINELKLYPGVVEKEGIELAVERMRKDMEVKVEGENAFELTYRSTDPKVAAQVANRLPQIFMEDTVKSRGEQAARATALFGDEAETLKKTLNDWEKKISQFKVEHAGELPEQLEVNMRGLERVGALMQTKSEELRIAEGRRSDMARSNYSGDSEAGRLSAAESALTKELVEAKTNWTDDHPDVKRMTRELAQLKSKRQEAEGSMTTEKRERAMSTARVGMIDRDIRSLQKQAEMYQARLDRTPRWAHELAVMNRDYEAVKTKYQSVISRKVEAELAQDLEAKSAKTLFNVISPATIPVVPTKPDRFGGLLIVLLVAMGLGILAGVLVEMRDDSIRDIAEVKERLPIPVLAVVPAMGLRGGERRMLMPSSGSPDALSKQPSNATIN
ncbi:MAG: GumC family protein [Myxococcaceae bacterium]